MAVLRSGRRVKAAVLWTGGKDCALALHAVRSRFEVACLATFVPRKGAFRAHPLALMRKQAASLGLPHARLTVRAPYGPGYDAALKRLRARWGVSVLVTGDIDRVEGRTNWIRERAQPLGFTVLTPLWGRSRRALLERHWRAGFEAVISFVNPPLGREWVGRPLDRGCVRALSRIDGVDLCGENGEYHTMVVAGPGFSRRVNSSKFP